MLQALQDRQAVQGLSWEKVMCSLAFKELMLDRDNSEFVAEIKRRLEVALWYNETGKISSYRATLKALEQKGDESCLTQSD